MTLAGTQRHRLNSFAMWALSLYLLTIPFFLGGNRPIAWTLYATLLALLAVYYFAKLLIDNIDPRITVVNLKIPSVLLMLFCGYIVLQVLPLGAAIPSSMVYLPEGILVASTISISVGDTILSLVRWMNIVLVGYFALQICANSIRAARFLTILFWIVVAHGLYGLMLRFQFGDTILFAQKWAYLGSATGGFVNRNSFATFLAIGAVIGVARIYEMVQQRSKDAKFGLLSLMDVRSGIMTPMLGLVLILIAIVATTSRMGLFATLLGMVVTFGLMRTGRSSDTTSRFRSMGIVVAVVIGAVAIMFLYGGSVIDRFSTVSASTDVRLELYKQVWGMITTRPLTGFGGGTFEFAYPMFHQSPVNFDLVWDRAHSSYLALWSDYGLIFGSLPMLVIAYVLSMLVGVHVKSVRADGLIVAGIGATVAVAVHSTVDFGMEMHAVTLLYTALVAGAVGKSISIRRGLEAN